MTKFREHKGLLVDSIATVVDVGSRAELVSLLQEKLRAFDGPEVSVLDWSKLEILPLGRDNRIGWDTHNVYLPGYGIFGMTDGPLS